MVEMIRTALVGCGSFARRHGQFLCEEKAVEGMSVEVACDLDAERAEAFARKYGIPRWSADLDRVLGEESIDAVLIVTPTETHVPLAIRALRAGKPVFCEKPLSTGEPQRRELRSALDETGGRLMVGYCFRFAPAFADARQLVAPAAFTVATALNNEPGGRAYLLSNACHIVDQVLSWHGSDVRDVSAVGADIEGQANPAEQFTITLRFGDGSIATIVCGGSAAGSWMPKWYYKTVGRDGGVAEVVPSQGWSLWVAGEEGPRTVCEYHQGHRLELRHFAHCLRTGEPFLVTPEQAMKVDQVLAAAGEQLGI